MNSQVKQLLSELTQRILSIASPKLLRVGINGVDGAGKTEFTKSLVEYLQTQTNRQVITATIDGFHNPRSIRYEKGRDSAEGFFRDSFNVDGMANELLKPLSTGGNRKYRTQIFDVRTDSVIEQELRVAQDEAILIVEGIFLLRKELVSYWDYKVYLDVPFEITLERMLLRDSQLFDSENEERKLFMQRYMPGQILYLEEARPKEMADVVIDNTDFNNPKIIQFP